MVDVGHRVIIVTYADYEDAELDGYAPTAVKVDGDNRPLERSSVEHG